MCNNDLCPVLQRIHAIRAPPPLVFSPWVFGVLYLFVPSVNYKGNLAYYRGIEPFDSTLEANTLMR